MDCDNSFSFKIKDEIVQLKNRIHVLESQLSNSRKVQSNSTTGGVKKNTFREQGTNSMLPNTVKPKDNNDKQKLVNIFGLKLLMEESCQ